MQKRESITFLYDGGEDLLEARTSGHPDIAAILRINGEGEVELGPADVRELIYFLERVAPTPPKTLSVHYPASGSLR